MVSTLRSGAKTVEFWMAIAVSVLVTIWPEFPKESFLAIGTWVVGRGLQKAFGFADPVTGKRAWETSEFWIVTIYGVLKALFPDIPQEAFVSVLGWVGVRTGVKVGDKLATGKTG